MVREQGEQTVRGRERGIVHHRVMQHDADRAGLGRRAREALTQLRKGRSRIGAAAPVDVDRQFDQTMRIQVLRARVAR